MSVVQRFNRTMIENCLRANQLRFLRDNDGDFRVEFGYNEKYGCEISFSLSVAGSQNDVYSIIAISDKRIPRHDWAKAVTICNEWNAQKRWPKAYLHVRDVATETYGAILLEQDIDLEPGVHQELLDHFTLTAFATSMSFWEWAHTTQGL